MGVKTRVGSNPTRSTNYRKKNEFVMVAKKYALAYCQKDALGLITCEKPKLKNGKEIWTGVQLTEKLTQIGKPWSLSKPRVVGYLDETIKKMAR